MRATLRGALAIGLERSHDVVHVGYVPRLPLTAIALDMDIGLHRYPCWMRLQRVPLRLSTWRDYVLRTLNMATQITSVSQLSNFQSAGCAVSHRRTGREPGCLLLLSMYRLLLCAVMVYGGRREGDNRRTPF
ncbi:hypothetical protein PENSPDRAFT_445696 [Peniophora sp. CONT]|nr:hypothetical protein PENSPDRAFT_445696 [Peniophora sp. CONT]